MKYRIKVVVEVSDRIEELTLKGNDEAKIKQRVNLFLNELCLNDVDIDGVDLEVFERISYKGLHHSVSVTREA